MLYPILTYCLLVWVFHSRRLNHLINSIHVKALRVTYKDYQSMFLELLQKENSVTIHQENLPILANLRQKIKHCESLTKLKNFIKSWLLSGRHCRLCKTYIAQVDFILSEIGKKLGV